MPANLAAGTVNQVGFTLNPNHTVSQRMKRSLLLLAHTLLCAAVADQTDIEALSRKAAAGDAAAQNELGARHQSGAGVAKDLTKAFELYHRAAAAGHAIAAYNLAFMHDMGIETPKDRKLANQWYRKSAELGYAPAMLNLGMNVASGDGTDADLVEGMMWVDLARFFTQREKDVEVKWRVRGAYDRLKGHLSKAQLKVAEERSRKWYEDFQKRQK